MKGKLFKIAEAGKITVGAGIFALLAIALLSTVGFVSTTADAAKSASTTVKVLNTPPQFDSDPAEVVPSSTTTPTTFGNVITFKVEARDSSDNGMYLLICKNYTGAEAIASSSTAPQCPGGNASDLIAVTESPITGNWPTATTVYATSSPINDAINEVQNWYAYLCDNETRNPRCTKLDKHGAVGSDSASPYYINHPYSLSGLTNDGPKLPGQTITFTAAATEATKVDVVGGADSVKLFLCKTAAFNGADCTGGAWASSTVGFPSNPTAAMTFAVPTQDGVYSGYPYIVDNHGAPALSGGRQGDKFDFVVSNAAPQVVASSISFASTTITLTNALDVTPGFSLDFQTMDNNSCMASTSQMEVKNVKVVFAQNNILGTTCKEGSAFDSNSCYTSDASTADWNLVCTQDQTVGSCSGANDTTSNWHCTFPLWSNTRPTDAGTPWAAGGNWSALVKAIDDNNASSSSSIDSAVRYAKVLSFQYIDLDSNSIDFGELEPGQNSPVLGSSTGAILGVKSKGNTSFDVKVQVSDMCPNWDGVKCTGNESSNTIFGARQKYGTSSVAYGSAAAVAGSTSTDPIFDLNVKKPTATGTPTHRDMYWGISIPANLTISGDYKGVNKIDATLESNLSTW